VYKLVASIKINIFLYLGMVAVLYIFQLL